MEGECWLELTWGRGVQEDLVTQSDSYIPFGLISKAAKMPEQGDLQYLQIFCKVPNVCTATCI
jgi:hypothetical protein